MACPLFCSKPCFETMLTTASSICRHKIHWNANQSTTIFTHTPKKCAGTPWSCLLMISWLDLKYNNQTTDGRTIILYKIAILNLASTTLFWQSNAIYVYLGCYTLKLNHDRLTKCSIGSNSITASINVKTVNATRCNNYIGNSVRYTCYQCPYRWRVLLYKGYWKLQLSKDTIVIGIELYFITRWRSRLIGKVLCWVHH